MWYARIRPYDSTYYMCSNTNIVSIEQEPINTDEHKIHTFYIHS